MSEPYPEFGARFYDVVYAQVRDGVDYEFYLSKMAAAGGPVLEIGSGTGRLLREALGRGVDAWGMTNRVRITASSREYVVVCRGP